MASSSIASSLVPPKLEVSDSEAGLVCPRERWNAWRIRWESYALIVKLADEDPKLQLAFLIQCFSAETITLVDSLPYEDSSQREQVAAVLDLLEKHFVGEVNEIFESFQFFSRQQ